MPSLDPIVELFRQSLTTVEADPQRVRPIIAKGDCCILLQLIRMKLDHFDVPIDTVNPGRFRGNRPLEQDMRTVLGDDTPLHVTKWGASHMRGALRDDEGRGNKRHIIRMIEALNVYRGAPQQLRSAYHKCIRAHHEYWGGFSIRVEVQPSDPTQVRLLKLLGVPSQGRVQQGLVYAILRRHFGATKRVTTKKTYAGDAQSSLGPRNQRGDVQVSHGELLQFAVEVKDTIVDEAAWGRVDQTHGRHDYGLFVLAAGFRPSALQSEISQIANTFAVHLVDFVLMLVFLTAVHDGTESSTVLAELIAVYNDEFVRGIERDSSLRIELIET